MSLPLPTGALSLTSGGAALVTHGDGSIAPDTATGFIVDDVRVLSQWRLDIDAPAVQLVARQRTGPSSDTVVFTIGAPDSIDPVATMERRRTLARRELREDITITTYRGDGAWRLRLTAGRDDQPVMVLGDGGTTCGGTAAGASGRGLRKRGEPGMFELDGPDGGARVEVEAPGWRLRDGQLEVDVVVERGVAWSSAITFTVDDDLGVAGDWISAGQVDAGGGPETRTTPEPLGSMVRAAGDDLRALTIPCAGRLVIGAGSPFFLALFGRDSLIASMQALLGAPGRLTDLLGVLARYQAATTDAVTRAQPGRIVHELRLGRAGVFGVPPRSPYYGAVDTPALFVAALGEAARWGAPTDAVAALLPAARAALEWCARDGDVDGDGFVESVPDPGGLTNLGWKDSDDSIVRPDGTVLVGTNSLPEVQAFWYRAERDLAAIEARLGEGDPAARLDHADRLAARFAEAFLYEEPDGSQFVGLALDDSKHLLEVPASNAGQVLWGGILSPRVARDVATRLVADDLYSGWGIRTLSRDAVAYNPLGYHRGAVWPHDTAIALHGAARYGASNVVRTLTRGLVDLGAALGGELPEVLAGIGRDELLLPVPYPAACRPQAWAAGSVLTVLRATLGLEPDVPAGVVHLHPALPEGWRVEVRGIRLGHHELSLIAEGDTIIDADAGGLTINTGPDATLAAINWFTPNHDDQPR